MITKKSVSKRYLFLTILLIILAGGLVLLPKYEKHEGIKPEILLTHAISPERYITPDELANKLINQDPSYILIDLRDEEAFNTYSLPNAINIPLEKLLDEDSIPYLNQNQYNVVLYSNNDLIANQAWIICNRLAYKNLFVLKGGLNNWFNTIINPPVPNESVASTAYELFSFRKAASMYFGVAYPEQINIDASSTEITPKKVITVKKKKKKQTEGGC